ncbi:RagB/SusD family nutrient uptake outer membrane protein [Spirosoma endbachense]|uniref:RagB/SusD family nutrient uptake outer membrane protein n=1 Tax=Spirosoma endbachense TaxID=2666025 RepID=A0A6P1W1Y4_9BACT|nr:RagB/SusD family nutrient uptake outer membrane protein [Spirosoma endbachense]QHV99423.1 RagB/SusD family nutrient uptake outer membrane protein [Spirosoma endbachense]
MKTIASVIVILFLVTMTSCGDQYLSVIPTDVLTDANFFKSEADAQSALIGVYGQVQSESTFGNVVDAANIEWTMSGDLYEQDQNTPRVELEMLSLPANNLYIGQLYSALFQGVSRANFVIVRVGQMANLTPQVKASILAQAKFLRGIFYYRLVNYFGGVSLITTELNASSKLDIPRASAADIWKQVETDLTEAAADLPLTWSGSDIGRATKGAALAFLVKAQLWQQKYQEAVNSSESIIALGVYGLLPNFRSVFLKTNENNKEMVFSTQYSSVNDASEGSGLDVRSAPRGAPAAYIGRAANSNFVPQTSWINSIERDQTGKIRDQRYYGVIIGPGESHPEMPGFVMPLTFPNPYTKTGYIVTKYWQEASLVNSGINVPIIRYSEVLLNYAEALNEVGRSADAMKQVNLVRTRATLDPKPLDLSKDKVLDAVFFERRMEFIWEPPGAFSDLNRRGRYLDFIKANRADYAKIQVDTKPWVQQKIILLPIPQSARDVNKSLTQNPGYPAFQ